MIWLWLIVPCAVALICSGVLASELKRIAEALEEANRLLDTHNAVDLENNNLIRDEIHIRMPKDTDQYGRMTPGHGPFVWPEDARR